MCDHFKSKNSPASDALMPANAEDVMRKYQESKAEKESKAEGESKAEE